MPEGYALPSRCQTGHRFRIGVSLREPGVHPLHLIYSRNRYHVSYRYTVGFSTQQGCQESPFG